MNTDCNNKDRLPLNGIPFTDEEPDEEGVSVYEHHRLTADSGQKPMRIDKFLMEHLYNTSRNRLQRAAEQEFILVNGRPVKSSYKVKPLDEIVILLDRPKYDNEIIAEDIPLDIVYEDEDLMVVDKPAGLVVHPGCGNYTGTLVNAIAWHLKDNPDYDPNDPTVGLVHRIDKDTSGLLVVAKKRRFQNASGQTVLQQNHQKTVQCFGLGKLSGGRRTYRRQHRPPPERPDADGSLPTGQRNRETCRHPLPRIGEFQLCHARGMQAGNRTYPSNPSPHETYRPSAFQRRTLWRKRDPARHTIQ